MARSADPIHVRRETALRNPSSRRPSPKLATGAVIAAVLCITAVFAPLVAPYDPAALDLQARWQGPSLGHLAGTDALGRDILSRLIFGGRIALVVAVIGVGLALLVGSAVGVLAGYRGGRLDVLVLVILDTLNSFPLIFLALAIVVIYGSSLSVVVGVVAVALLPKYARVTRALTLATKAETFILAERALGASPLRIVMRHVAPNIAAQVVIFAAIDIPLAITLEAGLSFLGLGVQPPQPSWGIMLADGFRDIQGQAWPVIGPAVAIAFSTLGFTLLGEAQRDRLDPQLRRLGDAT